MIKSRVTTISWRPGYNWNIIKSGVTTINWPSGYNWNIIKSGVTTINWRPGYNWNINGQHLLMGNSLVIVVVDAPLQGKISPFLLSSLCYLFFYMWQFKLESVCPYPTILRPHYDTYKITVKSVNKGHSRETKNTPFMSSCPLCTC